MTFVAALDEAALAAFGRYSPGAKSGGVWTDVKRAVWGKDGSTGEGVLDLARELPVRNVYGNRVGIQQLDEFLILVSGTGVGLDGTEVDRGLADLRGAKRASVQLWNDEHAGTGDVVVEPLNRQNIAAGHEIAFFGGDIVDVESRQVG